MTNVHILVGIPASGKSTWIKERMKGTDSAWHVSRDAIRFTLIGDTDDYFKYENQVFAEFVRQINTAIKNGTKDVYVDQTSLSPGSRRKILSRIRPLDDTKLTFDVFKCKFETALERNSKREGLARVPDDAMASMYRGFSVPDIAKENIHSYGFVNPEVVIHNT